MRQAPVITCSDDVTSSVEQLDFFFLFCFVLAPDLIWDALRKSDKDHSDTQRKGHTNHELHSKPYVTL